MFCCGSESTEAIWPLCLTHSGAEAIHCLAAEDGHPTCGFWMNWATSPPEPGSSLSSGYPEMHTRAARTGVRRVGGVSTTTRT